MHTFRHFLPVLAVGALTFASSVLADTFTLKNGEKIEGRIVQETPESVTIEYKVTATISDTRDVVKADIVSTEKTPPDEPVYQLIKGHKLGTNSYPVATYTTMMQALQNFVNTYPDSTHAAEIGQQLIAVAQEKSRVEGGELKISGRWITKDQVEKEKYQLQARAVFAQMQDQARRGDLVGALNTLDQLEKSFKGGEVLPDAIVLAQQILPQLKPTAELAIQNWQVQKKQRDEGNLLVAEPHRSELIAIQQSEQKQLIAAYEAAGKAGLKWPPFQSHNEEGLRKLIAKIEPEQKRLDLLPVTKMRQAIQLTAKSREALAAKDILGAEKCIQQAISLWGTYEAAQRTLKDVTALKTQFAQATPASIIATPAPATPATAHAEPTVVDAKPAATKTVEMEDEPTGFFLSKLGLALIAVVLLGAGYGYMRHKKSKASEDATV